eukprot:s245_g19.t2
MQSAVMNVGLAAVPSAAAETLNMFAQLRTHRQERRRREAQPVVRPAEPDSTPQNARCYQDTCTICLERFASGDHCCRLVCRHVFHCLCVGEYLQHSTVMNEPELEMTCPNCRHNTRVDVSWIQPNFDLRGPHPMQEQHQEDEAVRTPVPTDDEDESQSVAEYATPDGPQEGAFPWWPIPETEQQRTDAATDQERSFHASVRCTNGDLGLLVDPGSYGNLVGSEWLREAQTTLQDKGIDSEVRPRETPLRVGGVGKGSQECTQNATIPLAMTRSDGSIKGGTFTAPVIESSNAPALLGLKSLTQHRAVLDLVNGQLHLLGEGECRLEFPAGTESYTLERAPTGHLLLPFQQYAKLTESSQGVRHLFTESEVGYVAVAASAPTPTSPAEGNVATEAEAHEEMPNVEVEKPRDDTVEGESAGPVDQLTGDAAAPAEEPAATPVAVKEEPVEQEEPGEQAEPDVPQDKPSEASETEAADVPPSASPSTAEALHDQDADVPPSAPEPTGEAPPPTSATPHTEPARKSRSSDNIEELTLDEVADRMELPSESRLSREDRSEEPKRRRRHRGRRRRSDSDQEDSEPRDETRTKRALPSADENASVATGQTTPYDTDRELDPEEKKVDKSYVSLPPATDRPSQKELMKVILKSREDAYPTEGRGSGSASSSARPATAKSRPAAPKPPATIRGSVGASIPKEHGAVKANPPIPPPARRVVVDEQADAPQPKRTPPTPPKAKRHMPPPEPKDPPTPKQRAVIAKAEAHLASVMANPNATRTAKRKARRDVLVISNFRAVACAIANLNGRTERVRPIELLRAGFNSLLEFIKTDRYDMVWIDLAKPSTFVGATNLSQVMQRIRCMVTACRRYDVPCVIASHHSSAWHSVSVTSLIDVCQLHVSTHRWCAFGIRTQLGNPSAVTYRCASTFAWQSTPCRCPDEVEHVHDLALRDPCCTAHQRHAIEVEATEHLFRSAWSCDSVSGKSADSTVSLNVESGENKPAMTASTSSQSTHHDVSSASHWARGTVSGQSSLHVQRAETTTHNFCTEYKQCPCCQVLASSAQAFCNLCEEPLAPGEDIQTGYPTEQRLAAQKRAKEGIVPRKRKKTVEQHFDDCGEDMTPLEEKAHMSIFNEDFSDDSSEGDSTEDISKLLSSFVTHGFYGSECDLIAETYPSLTVAVDWQEACAVLTARPYGVEIVELCGGEGLTTQMCVRRKLAGGHNFEILTGTDLTNEEVQRSVLEYLKLAKPLAVIMAPRCGPFGPLGRFNQAINPDGWLRNYALSAPLASFCGKVALFQLSEGRHFLVEQPQGSTLFEEPPWPKVLSKPETKRIIFHQCRVKQYVNGLLCKKATELIASSEILLTPFIGLVCTGDHQHAVLMGGQAHKAQRWSREMRDRIAFGIQRLARKVLSQSKAELAHPSMAVGSDDPAQPELDEGEGESWRRCKGCRWRLPKNDSAHSRVPGECKHPDVPTVKFECPACKARKPRDHQAHTYGPNCRHALSAGRKKAPKRPKSQVPAAAEPTSSLRARGMGDADEQTAEDRLEAEGDARAAAPGEESSGARPAEDTGAEVPSDAAPSDRDLQIVPADGEAGALVPAERRGRGPDVLERIRRTYREGEAQTPDPSDWSSFDISASLRGLRLSEEAGQRRILRKLHLRWWHASSNRMIQLLKTAGIPQNVLDLVPEVVDTCRVCRLWQKPSSDNVAVNRVVTGFNLEVEGDLIFITHGSIHTVLHLVDRGTRWSFTCVLPNRTTEAILTGLDQWVSIFGPMQVLIFDGETGLDDPAATQYFELKGITKRTSAPGQHVRICDRRTQVLRDTVHKISSQLSEEGIAVPLSRVLAEATYAGNALTSIRGVSPYTAVLGRVPPLLPDALSITDDTEAHATAQHTHRLREIAVQCIAEASAQDRLKRASHTTTKPAAEEYEYKLGEQVEYFRPPLSKDATGWRGPATICDLSRLEHGRIGIRTRSDNVLTCRLQDVRRCLAYMADMQAPLSSPAGQAQQVLQEFVDSLKPGITFTFGNVYSAQEGWRLAKPTAAHNMVYQAAVVVAECVFQLQNLAAVRLGVGVRTLPEKKEYTASTLIFWMASNTKSLEFHCSEETKVSFVGLVGQSWPQTRFVQFLMVNAEDDFQNALHDNVSESDRASVSNQATGASTHDGLSVGGPLSTIAEESQEDAMVTWNELEEAFGISSDHPDAAELAEAYTAITTETMDAVPPAFVTSDELNDPNWLQDVAALQGADIPTWSDVSFVTNVESFMSQSTAHEHLSHASREVPDLHDQDDYGIYVALEAYYPECKLFEGLDRLPNSDEHVEMRFYETYTRKVVIDRSDDLLTDQEIHEHGAEVMQAMLDELQTWNGFKCFKRIPKSQTSCVIDTRWVLKWKEKGGKRIIRARLCLRGFKESGCDDDTNHSATATRLSQRLLVSETVLRGWIIASTDIPKAFLQGVSYQELAETTGKPLRDVSFTLTAQGVSCLQQIRGFEGFDPRQEVLHCLKPGTGCRDAPRCFSMQLRKVTSAFGLQSSFLDSEFELLFDENNELRLAVIKHVDDLKICGPKDLIEKFVAHVAKAFGKLDIEWYNFTFCGVRHTQNEDIVLDQIKFISAIKEMQVPEALSKTDQPLPEQQQRQFLSLLMTVAYALLTRIDVAVYVTALQRECQKPKPIHVRRLNLLLRWMQKNPRGLRYRKMPEYPNSIVQFSDSGFKARSEDGLSVRGLVSLRMAGSDLKSPSSAPCHVLEFVSKSQRHVTRSTFSSELFAATDSVDSGILTRLALHELKHGPLTDELAKSIVEGAQSSSIQLHAVLDAKSVTAAATAPVLKIPAEPSLLVHVRPRCRAQREEPVVKKAPATTSPRSTVAVRTISTTVRPQAGKNPGSHALEVGLVGTCGQHPCVAAVESARVGVDAWPLDVAPLNWDVGHEENKGFTADINGRFLQGKVMERREAQQAYQTAIKESRCPAALAQHGFSQAENGMDLYRISLGNLPTRQPALVNFSFVQELPLQDSDMKNQGFLRLLLPAFVGAPSRYSPEDDPSEKLLQAAVNCKWKTIHQN